MYYLQEFDILYKLNFLYKILFKRNNGKIVLFIFFVQKCLYLFFALICFNKFKGLKITQKIQH